MSIPQFTAESSVYGVYPAQPSYGVCEQEAHVICGQQCMHAYDPAACRQKCTTRYIAECIYEPYCYTEYSCNADGVKVAVEKCRQYDGSITSSEPTTVGYCD
ncbi:MULTISPECIES: hypothetical protein [unclassified Streptomyces]|uniref:hypothetical protein n=1 Tax=unclassified Streptomyces TaxID=2593676 RepID=UPI003803BA68